MRVLGIVLAVLIAAACQSPEERLAEHRARAAQYLEAEQHEEAKIELLNVLQIDPDDADAHYQLGETLWLLNDFAESRWQYREATRLDPGNVERRVRLAQVEAAFGRHEDALAQANEALSSDPENVEALLIRGTLRFRKGDADGLLVDVEKVLEIEPENVHALRLKGRAHEVLQQPSAAEATYRRMIEVRDDTLSRHLFAVFLGTQNRFDDARVNYIKAVENAEDVQERTQARIALANFHLNMRDIEATEEVLLAARDDNPDNIELLLQLARFYAGLGKTEQAEEMLELRVQSAENPVPALLILGDFHRQLRNDEAAIAAVERALEADPESELALLRKSEYLMDRSAADPTLAIEAKTILEGVMERNPNSVRGMFTQAKYMLLDGRPAEAVPLLRRVVEEQPNSNVYLLLGQAYLTLRQFELARSELLRAVQLDANNVAARARLAALYLQMGERELAVQEAQQALARNPADIRVKMVLAEGLAGEGRRDEALELLENLEVEGGPELTPDLKFHSARLLRSLGAYEEAHAMLEEVALARPGDPEVVVEQALIDLFAQDLGAALGRLDTAIASNPTEARLYELRGRVRMGITRSGKLVFPDEAEADFKQSIELDPDQSEAYLQLAQLYQRTGRLDDAIKSYEAAAAAESGNAGLQVVLGTLYEQVGRYDDAIRTYEMATRLDPSQAIAKNNLAWLLAEYKADDEANLDRALSLAQDAKERLPQNPFVADTLGYVLLKKQVPTAAISLFKEAIEGYRVGDPNRSTVRYHLAQAYQSNGDNDMAIAELERALSEVDAFPDRVKAEDLLKELQTG